MRREERDQRVDCGQQHGIHENNQPVSRGQHRGARSDREKAPDKNLQEQQHYRRHRSRGLQVVGEIRAEADGRRQPSKQTCLPPAGMKGRKQ